MYKPVRLDARDRAVRLDAQGKAEQQLGGAERLGGAGRRLGGSEQRLGGSERRLGRAGEAAELCGAAELLGAQGKAEQRLGRAERLGGAERRLGGAGEAAELCGAAEILGVPLTITPLSELHRPVANGRGGIGRKGMEPKAKARMRRGAPGFLV